MSVALLFASPPLRYGRHDAAEQQRVVTEAFAGMGWQMPALLAVLDRELDL
ncbi:MAG: hypothetical protein ACR2JG_09530 [Geodermatophilaceae bacterium]